MTVDLVLLQHRAQCSGQQRNPTGQLGQGFQVGSVGGRVVVIEPLADLVGEDVGEKFWSWTEPGGDLHRVITRDELLDNLMLYWLPGTGASSARLYWESLRQVNE
ncbi:hypothetical protein [Amycolatopsis regifaucium]|uniref:Uncharacterized protein n=1 Tax=Amycolatopsis regifaucium TaxID=546365 RepID=A0ABX3DXB9_9PSEU|nr:hypothetical protein [Amycolatopsis regifaucium]OKA09050.1 hypothetical protein ATP06_0210070 [Amycolatopsis regifaucium]